MKCNQPGQAVQTAVLAKAGSTNEHEDDYRDFALSHLSSEGEPVRRQGPRPPTVKTVGDKAASAQAASEPVGRAALPSGQPTGSPETRVITIAVKQVQKLEFDKPIERVEVQDPEVAQIRVLSPTRLVITGEKTGTTQLTLDSGGDTRSFVIIVEPNLDQLRELIASIAPGAEVQLRTLNASVVLTGCVPDAETSKLIEDVALAATGKALITHLRVAGVQQTMLHVVIAEVNKEALRELGINWAMGGSDWSRDFFFANNVAQLNPTVFSSSGLPNVLTGQQVYSVGATANGANTNLTFGFPRAEMQVFLRALRQNNLGRTLAEPNLVAFSGQTATFLAGGEVPIPVTQGGATAGAITIEYKEFGVRLAFTPTILGGQVVRLHVMSEHSDALPSDQMAGSLPLYTFTTRRVESTIECGNGQTFVIAGLLRDSVRATVSKIPGLGDLPVLGALFTSTSYQNSETELIVFVTPRLVEPLDPHQVPDPPGAKMTKPTDFELFGMGRLEGEPRKHVPNSAAKVDDNQKEEDASRDGTALEPSSETETGRLASGVDGLRGPWGFEIDDEGK